MDMIWYSNELAWETKKKINKKKNSDRIKRVISGTVSEKKQSPCLSEDYFSTYFLESILIKYMYCTKRSDFNWG